MARSLPRILFLNPFHGGSHAAFAEQLTEGLAAEWRLLTLPARHWKWRMRGAAVHFASEWNSSGAEAPDLIVATSMLALTDFLSLVPNLVGVPSFLYFHENQLTYPDRAGAARDHHFGFTQLISARAATLCGFNSRYNLDSFSSAAIALLGALPDAVPSHWVEEIVAKSHVLPVPLCRPAVDFTVEPPLPGAPDGPVILWNHRWEHDKNPEAFFAALTRLETSQRPFRLAIAGPRFERWPACFDDIRARWPQRIIQFGPCEDRAAYAALLQKCDVAVSTAHHEFFGIAMLEAAHHGALVLVPNRLAYPEIFPVEYRYDDDDALHDRLCQAVDRWMAGHPLRTDRRALTERFGRPALEAFAAQFSGLTKRDVGLSVLCNL